MAIKVNGTTVIDDNRNLVNIASGAGGGYWNELSSVTLGGSVVSSINVTLTSGYDAHRIDFRLPVPDGGSYKKNLLVMATSGGTGQSFTFQPLVPTLPNKQRKLVWNGMATLVVFQELITFLVVL